MYGKLWTNTWKDYNRLDKCMGNYGQTLDKIKQNKFTCKGTKQMNDGYGLRDLIGLIHMERLMEMNG